MDSNLKNSIWRQFGAVIDYLGDTMTACPDSLWHACLWNHPDEKPEFAQFWYRAYHTLFWLDLYLTGAEEGFLPPPPFALIEQDEDGPLPERAYTKAELLDYQKGCRARCRATIAGLTDETLLRRCVFGWGECSFLELLIYNLRHVQEHTGQLNLFLGQHNINTPDYETQLRGDDY
jgi:hypothetical protein